MNAHTDIGGTLYTLATAWSLGFLPPVLAIAIPLLLIGLPLFAMRRGAIAKSLAVAAFPLFWLSPMWWFMAFPDLYGYARGHEPWQIDMPWRTFLAYLPYGALCIACNRGLRKLTLVFWGISLPLVFVDSVMATLGLSHFS